MKLVALAFAAVFAVGVAAPLTANRAEAAPVLSGTVTPLGDSQRLGQGLVEPAYYYYHRRYYRRHYYRHYYYRPRYYY